MFRNSKLGQFLAVQIFNLIPIFNFPKLHLQIQFQIYFNSAKLHSQFQIYFNFPMLYLQVQFQIYFKYAKQHRQFQFYFNFPKLHLQIQFQIYFNSTKLHSQFQFFIAASSNSISNLFQFCKVAFSTLIFQSCIFKFNFKSILFL